MQNLLYHRHQREREKRRKKRRYKFACLSLNIETSLSLPDHRAWPRVNRGHHPCRRLSRKGTLVAPVEGTTRARIVSVEWPRTSAYTWTGDTSRRVTSLLPLSSEGLESRFGPSHRPSLWTPPGDITCTSTIRKSVTGLAVGSGRGGVGTKRGATLLRNDSWKGRLRGIRGGTVVCYCRCDLHPRLFHFSFWGEERATFLNFFFFWLCFEFRIFRYNNRCFSVRWKWNSGENPDSLSPKSNYPGW